MAIASQNTFLLALGFYSVSFVLCVLAYGTGFWFEAEGEDRLFQRLGLWEACFDGYEHTSDYIGKAYYGCWWIFHKEYSYIRDWILPPWFVAVQTLMTFGLVFEFIGMGLIPMMHSPRENANREILTAVVTGLATGCIGVSVVVFGIMVGEDRTWMPRPDMDRLGWSFGCAVVSGFFAAFTCITVTIHTLIRQYELLPYDDPYSINHPHGKKEIPGLGAGAIPMKTYT